MRSLKALKNSYVNISMYLLVAIFMFITKKYMISGMGEELTGLTSIYQNTIDLLKLLEMGITVSVIFSLYKPIKDNDFIKIKSVINVLKVFYQKCGIGIMAIGMIVTFILPFVIKSNYSDNFIRINFIVYLFTAVIYYFVGYKICILHASQNGYIVTLVDGVCKIIQNTIQIYILINTKSYILFLITLSISNIVYMII
ncbi:MAG: hypothetical protein ACRCYE_02285, partial [Sarcina sp.]